LEASPGCGSSSSVLEMGEESRGPAMSVLDHSVPPAAPAHIEQARSAAKAVASNRSPKGGRMWSAAACCRFAEGRSLLRVAGWSLAGLRRPSLVTESPGRTRPHRASSNRRESGGKQPQSERGRCALWSAAACCRFGEGRSLLRAGGVVSGACGVRPWSRSPPAAPARIEQARSAAKAVASNRSPKGGRSSVEEPYDKISLTIFPCTSVSRKSRPWKR
jgi:hypothetical protein